ncbi:MAG: hypothetical protein IPK00_18705 [Deltaproteobacteria bacterium]|nr:hypothetical protein [Deltaproteobacteria bacterium]
MDQPAEQQADQKHPPTRRIAWADLLKRVFEADALRCPDCGARMRMIAAITEADVAHRILECLALAQRAPPLGPGNEIGRGIDRAVAMDRVRFDQAHGEMQADSGFDPGFEFDQTLREPQSPNDAI